MRSTATELDELERTDDTELDDTRLEDTALDDTTILDDELEAIELDATDERTEELDTLELEDVLSPQPIRWLPTATSSNQPSTPELC